MKNTKFRFWGSFNATFTYSDKVGKLSKFFEMYEETIIGGNNPILEQYTELKDKNGKDIYEGNHFGEPNYPVVFADGAFWNEGELLRDSLHLEIIGNIHQNPESL